jgi:hypothetical protein
VFSVAAASPGRAAAAAMLDVVAISENRRKKEVLNSKRNRQKINGKPYPFR